MSAARVLIADDERDIRTVLALTLQRSGFEVTAAVDGVDALERLAGLPPDVVILDVMMPRLDGLETLRRIRGAPATAHIPVIMLTAKAQVADRMAGFERGADDYLAKPFDPAEVVARVKALLRRTAETRQATPLLGLLGGWASGEGLVQLGRDLEAARDIQHRLQPTLPTSLAGLEVGAALHPSAVVGGDFFDVIPMGERVGVAVGDVSGKGISAALLMVMVRTLLREIATGLPEPADILRRLNASLCRDMPPSMFVTLVVAVLDPAEVGHVVLASGGHPPPFLLDGAGPPRPVEVGGTLVGAFPEVTFAQVAVTLQPGEGLLLVTDGVLEVRDATGARGTPAGFSDLLAGRDRPPPAVAEAIVGAAVAGAGADVRDDATAFVMRRPLT